MATQTLLVTRCSAAENSLTVELAGVLTRDIFVSVRRAEVGVTESRGGAVKSRQGTH
jgi:hypothetical protein